MDFERPFRKKVKKIMYKILSALVTTQGLFTERRDMPPSLVKIDLKFKDTKTGFSSLKMFRKEFNIYLRQSQSQGEPRIYAL